MSSKDRLQTSTNDRSNSPTPNNARSSLPSSDLPVNSQCVRDMFLQTSIYARSGLLGLYTGPQALRSLSPAAREEILTLFPELKAYDYSPESARPLPSGRQSRRLAQRHAAKGRDLVC